MKFSLIAISAAAVLLSGVAAKILPQSHPCVDVCQPSPSGCGGHDLKGFWSCVCKTSKPLLSGCSTCLKKHASKSKPVDETALIVMMRLTAATCPDVESGLILSLPKLKGDALNKALDRSLDFFGLLEAMLRQTKEEVVMESRLAVAPFVAPQSTHGSTHASHTPKITVIARPSKTTTSATSATTASEVVATSDIAVTTQASSESAAARKETLNAMSHEQTHEQTTSLPVSEPQLPTTLFETAPGRSLPTTLVQTAPETASATSFEMARQTSLDMEATETGETEPTATAEATQQALRESHNYNYTTTRHAPTTPTTSLPAETANAAVPWAPEGWTMALAAMGMYIAL